MKHRRSDGTDGARIVLSVAGMTCGHCERKVAQALEAVPGVDRARADARRGRAEAWLRAGAEDGPGIRASLASAVAAAGYEAAARDDGKGRRDGLAAAAIGLALAGIFALAEAAGFFSFVPVPDGSSAPGMLLVVGLLTGLHCVSMCGGIALSQGMKGLSGSSADETKGRARALAPSLAYNAGRVVSYTAVGALAGSLGGVLDLGIGGRSIVMAAAGLFMVLMALRLGGILPPSRFRIPLWDRLRGRAGAWAAQAGSFAVGLANGLMPCGPLQALQLYALGSGSAAAGAQAMFLFSLGTVPALLAFGAGGAFLPVRLRTGAVRAGAVLVAFLGLASLGRAWALSGLESPGALLRGGASASPAFAGWAGPASPASPPSAPQAQTAAAPAPIIARRAGNVQIVEFDLSPRRYAEFVVQTGIPVRWVIRAAPGTVNGCNSPLVVPSLGIQQALAVGETVIEFTPGAPGVVPYSCWMGMIRSRFTVVADLAAYGPVEGGGPAAAIPADWTPPDVSAREGDCPTCGNRP